MKNFKKFMGMMPILPTPIDKNGHVDKEDITSLVNYCLNADSKAIGHLAGASEYTCCSMADRKVIIKSTVDAVAGKVPVFIGTAAPSMGDTLYNCQQAEDMGADMLMVCSPPMGYATLSEIYNYYEKICSAVKIPIIVQDTGASSHVFTPEFLVKLYQDFDNIGYVKAEGGYWQEKLYQLMQIAPDSLQVIGGAAGKNMPMMLKLGITAYMTGTEAQEIHNSVVQAYLSGDEAKAFHLYYTTLLPYLEVYTATSFHKSLKHMLKRRGIIKNDSTIFPNTEIEQTSQFVLDELDWVLDKINKGTI